VVIRVSGGAKPAEERQAKEKAVAELKAKSQVR
jgi:hypothetical protein